MRRPLLVIALATVCVAGAALGSTAGGGVAARIRTFANRWLGTPYLWGGDSRAGLDCSAYLREMYRELFGVELPRTTRDQINLGVDLPVTADRPEQHWVPGDLIFYIDRAGIPNHVVVYMGGSQLTHSVSGRGVVVDGMKQLWGRRIVARRLLIPSSRESGGYGPIPAAGPIIPREVPCPPSVTAKSLEVKRYKQKPVDITGELAGRDICDYRALAKAVEGSGDVGRKNAAQLNAHAAWLEEIDSLKGTF